MTQDSFNRLQLSAPTILFSSNSASGKQPYLFDEIIQTSGSSTASSTTSSIDMSTNLTVPAVNGKVVRQSFKYISSRSGMSKLMYFTAVLESTGGGVSGSTSRVGCFDDSTDKTAVSGSGSGFFFELSGTTMNVVERYKNTEYRIPKSSWNLDSMDV